MLGAAKTTILIKEGTYLFSNNSFWDFTDHRISHLFFLDQMKDLKSQMLQMQQTQNFLLKNIMSQAWPPLPAQKVNPFQAQMY